MKYASLVWVALICATPALAQVSLDDLEQRDGVYYAASAQQPYSGLVVGDGLEGELEDGRRSGKWAFYSASGAKQREVLYVDGAPLHMVGWHVNGRKESETFYAEGIREGPARMWDAKGTLRAERPWKANQLHGEEKVYDHHGNVHLVTSYKQGTRHGPTTWYYPDGSVKWETHFDEGKRTGTWLQYGAEGSMSMETHWNNGVLAKRVNPHAGH